MPDTRVVAIKPEAGNFDLLSRNVDGLAVETVNAAVSSAPGRARTVDPGHGHWGYRTTDAAEDVADAVPHVTINSIYHSHAAKTFPFLVKVDIEGAESDLFADNTEWVARTPLLIIELHDWLMPKGRTSQSFLQCIAKNDRDIVYRGEDIYSIANDFDALAA